MTATHNYWIVSDPGKDMLVAQWKVVRADELRGITCKPGATVHAGPFDRLSHAKKKYKEFLKEEINHLKDITRDVTKTIYVDVLEDWSDEITGSIFKGGRNEPVYKSDKPVRRFW